MKLFCGDYGNAKLSASGLGCLSMTYGKKIIHNGWMEIEIFHIYIDITIIAFIIKTRIAKRQCKMIAPKFCAPPHDRIQGGGRNDRSKIPSNE